VALVGRTAFAPVGFTFNVIIKVRNNTTPHSTLALWLLSSACSHQPSSVNPRRSNVPVAIRSSVRRPSLCPRTPFTAPPITPRPAAVHPLLCHRSLPPFTPPQLIQPPLTPSPYPALRCATLHPSFRRSSPFAPSPFTPPLYCAPFTRHSTALQPSLPHP
jgi:hypothetical protein